MGTDNSALLNLVRMAEATLKDGTRTQVTQCPYCDATEPRSGDQCGCGATVFKKAEPTPAKGRSFRGNDLRGAIMKGEDLRNADFTNADLRGAILKADLRGAKFTRADLRGAILKGSRLDGADFESADMRGMLK